MSPGMYGQLTFLCKSSLIFFARKSSLLSVDLEMTGLMVFREESIFTTIGTKGLLYRMMSVVNKKIIFPTEDFSTYWADELSMLRVPLSLNIQARRDCNGD
ncbi:hypothetical protein AVEN_136257-1 [Araneus ventricosus]|uniref:Uncharacterized protein n=1 Tax=Araneus ventricosus TaxID=182803 RepID=A0A4Y2LCC7_ARAVE|nr:hypothetical protein AVEN_247378-1 [Araneus ventricosus]GBN12408.1 hypothetical protein AVEN_272069-1 [Araneus ventricosus]GBO08339.1 hypothetical protein AVEN_136257-1 [Araneus ventricosus]